MNENRTDDRALASLMRAAQAGDAKAYVELLRTVTPRVRQVVRSQRRFLRAEDIEDLVQDVLLSLHAVRSTYDPQRPFMPWLLAITRIAWPTPRGTMRAMPSTSAGRQCACNLFRRRDEYRRRVLRRPAGAATGDKSLAARPTRSHRDAEAARDVIERGRCSQRNERRRPQGFGASSRDDPAQRAEEGMTIVETENSCSAWPISRSRFVRLLIHGSEPRSGLR